MRKIRILIIVMFFYVFLQFSWWAYMLINLNNEVFAHKIELAEMQNQNAELRNEQEYKLNEKLNAKRWMVAGEGFVFLSLLLFGIYKILEAYNREYQLARQQKNFLLSITHEFKSPLAAVKLNLQTLQRHQLDTEKRNAILKSSVDETNRLNNLVENALMAAQIETHSFAIGSEEINLSECLENTLRNRMLISGTSEKIKINIENEIFIKGDCIAANSILLNLIENAEKYSANDCMIHVSLKKKDKEAELIVADNGNGIPDNEKENVFQKFYRVGNEDTRKTKGTGLGLYIVDQLVKLHGAKITVADNVPKGTVFKIYFPLS